MIHIEKLTSTYHKKGQPIKAIDNLTLHIAAREFVTIQGPSGSGKTTLLRTLGAMFSPTAGQVMVNGQETTMRNVLTSSSLARLVSNEGPLQVTSY